MHILFFFRIPCHPLLTKINLSTIKVNKKIILNYQYISQKEPNKIPSSKFVISENAEYAFLKQFSSHIH